MITILKPNPFFRKLISASSKRYSKDKSSNLHDLLLSMPKEPRHVTRIQNQRIKAKAKSSKFAPGKVTLQVLGTGAKGAPRSLYVFSDQSRYLFNCGEGTQRLAHELKLKLAKLEHIFITQPIWQNFGGLPGTCLTMQDVGVPQVTLHGPDGLKEMFEAAKKFVVLKNLKINIAECLDGTVFEDNVMKVRYVPLSRRLEVVPEVSAEESSFAVNASNTVDIGLNLDIMVDEGTSTLKYSRARKKRAKSISSYSSENSSSSERSRKKRKRKKNRSRSLSTAGSSLQSDKVDNDSYHVMKEKGVSMSYICRLQPRPGALSLEKCVTLGVPSGPLLGQLKSGQDVKLSNGDVVRSRDVCEPDDPGPLFIVIDCPSEEYISSLLNNDVFRKHQKFAKREDDVASVVIHFTPRRVVEDPRYKGWVDSFAPSTKHLMLNETNTCMGSLSVHRIQHKLNMLSPDIFPLLGDQGTEIFIQKENANQDENKGTSSQTSIAVLYPRVNTLSAYHLRPKKGLDRSEEIKLTPLQYIKETMTLEGFPKVIEELRNTIRRKTAMVRYMDYPRILFLGTGSCIPNKTRNTSGILLELALHHNILLDCGEGTYGQMVRFFGKDKVDEVLADVTAIYISHLHADHHIGVVGVLQGRRRAFKRLGREHQPVYLFAPLQLFPWLTFYDKFFEHIKPEFEFISNVDLIASKPKLSEIYQDKVMKNLNVASVKTCLVNHCPNAFGVAITLLDGGKITYSGDTMPCEDLIELGMNSNLLIHEATMEDELLDEAVAKLHSTTSQAIEIGKRMEAKHILLTHFSQRYAKLPRFNDNFSSNVGIAFDNMRVRLDELTLVPLFNPALKIMFAEHYDELEQKAAKRQLRQERESDISLSKIARVDEQ